jgi:hypothetical protein
LHGQLVLMLRRGRGGGRGYIEGLEIRWGLVSNILQALTKHGRWLDGEPDGPMHKFYQEGLFDVLSKDELYQEHGEDARTVEQLLAAGVDVRLVGEVDVGAASAGDGCVGGEAVRQDVFCNWLELREMPIGSAAAAWWLEQPASSEGCVDSLRHSDDECAADLFAVIESELREAGTLPVGGLTACALSGWLWSRLRGRFSKDDLDDEYDFSARLSLEFAVVAGRDDSFRSTGCAEAPLGSCDPDRDPQATVDYVLNGWPRVDEQPTVYRGSGRFPKSYPLEFPMGLADLWDKRPRDVTVAEWVQHMLRLLDGRMVQGLRGHRVVWAMVNTLLLSEAGGKGFVVHRNVMRRLGWRIVGGEVLTKGKLRELMEQEDTVRSMVHQLMSVGKDVRSTPMQWGYEGKKLDVAVKHLAWCPPWVMSARAAEQEQPFLLGSSGDASDGLYFGSTGFGVVVCSLAPLSLAFVLVD